VIDDLESEAGGHLSSELFVGDTVLVKREPTALREGPLRFQSRVYPTVFRVSRKIDRHTFILEHVTGRGTPVGFKQPVNADRLVKLDLPELPLRDESRRELEMFDERDDSWKLWRVDRFSVDGRVRLMRLHDPQRGSFEWHDLSRCRYRWVLSAADAPALEEEL
jgi:hypothetical protein